MLTVLFFFFKQKTAYEMRISDWSSDVCSSDLHVRHRGVTPVPNPLPTKTVSGELNGSFGTVNSSECHGRARRYDGPVPDQHPETRPIAATDRHRLPRHRVGTCRRQRSDRAHAAWPDRKSTRLNSSH